MRKGEDPAGDRAEGGVRLDVFLDVCCLLPTRSKAKEACEGGKVDVNGSAARPNKVVRPGDALAITLPSGRRTFVIREVTDRHVPKARARTLVEETTPPPTAEELERRWLDRQLAPRRDDGAGKLSHRERRERDRLRGR